MYLRERGTLFNFTKDTEQSSARHRICNRTDTSIRGAVITDTGRGVQNCRIAPASWIHRATCLSFYLLTVGWKRKRERRKKGERERESDKPCPRWRERREKGLSATVSPSHVFASRVFSPWRKRIGRDDLPTGDPRRGEINGSGMTYFRSSSRPTVGEDWISGILKR